MTKTVIDVAKEIESCTEAMISIGKCKIDLKGLADALIISVRGLIEVAERGDEKSKEIAMRTLNKINSIPAPIHD